MFATPEDATNALVEALASDNYPLFLSVAGPQMAGFWGTADSQKDVGGRDSLAEAARSKGFRTDSAAENRKVLYAGTTAYAFPAPLVKTVGGWRFDDEAGSRELTARRIQRNETAVIETCRRFRDAEYEFFSAPDRQVHTFAPRIRSTPGQHDGLFWSEPGREDESPVGPQFAAAAFTEHQPSGGTRPFFGYYFKVLLAQGPDAPGGALDYRTKGRLRRGFALIAWPAEYGLDGTQTFLLNHLGDIYEKDLGANTARIAQAMTTFNPDRSWATYAGLD